MSYISTNKQAFGIVAKDYKKYRSSYNSKLYKYLISLVNNKKPLAVLDLGCGVGNSTEPILKLINKNSKIFGCDPDVKMLAEGSKSAKKQSLPIVYVQGSAEKIPFEKQFFDLVFSGAAFHWFATIKAMKEIKRVLKKDGVYAVFWTKQVDNKPTIGSDLYMKYKWQGIPTQLREPEYVKSIFTKSGFKNVKNISIPYSERRTVEEIIGLLKTNSTYSLMSTTDKKTFVKEMTKAYVDHLGKGIEVTKEEIIICFGTNN